MLIERIDKPARHPSYILVEKLDNTIQLRQMLKAFRNDTPPPINIGRNEFFSQLGWFVKRIHINGIFHRDLTGGNILVHEKILIENDKPQLEFSIIDVSRARFYRRVARFRRYRDLARIRIPKEDRYSFFIGYNEGSQWHCKRFWHYWRIISILYRLKYNLKKPRRLLRLLKNSDKMAK